MKNKKLLAGLLLATVTATATWLSYSFADDTTTSTGSVKSETTFKTRWMGERRGGWFGHLENLTDAEKTALTSMTDEQKKAFFETKKTQMEAIRTARENVIDKLLAWTTLTQEEENIRAEIITQRAEMKVEMEEMKNK